MRIVRILVLFLCSASPALAQSQYFPASTFEWQGQPDALLINWYSGVLKSLEEPSLWRLSLQNKHALVYRFDYIPTFTHPVSIRIAFADEGIAEVISKEATGLGGYNPGHLTLTRERKLSIHEAKELLDLIDRAQFWKLLAEDPKAPRGNDGSEWILEGVRDGSYHIVDRWSPKNGSYHDLGLYLLKQISDLKIPQHDIY